MRSARRLTPLGRVVLTVYIVFSGAGAVWLMLDLLLESIAWAAAIEVPVAVGAGFYGRRVAGGG